MDGDDSIQRHRNMLNKMYLIWNDGEEWEMYLWPKRHTHREKNRNEYYHIERQNAHRQIQFHSVVVYFYVLIFFIWLGCCWYDAGNTFSFFFFFEIHNISGMLMRCGNMTENCLTSKMTQSNDIILVDRRFYEFHILGSGSDGFCHSFCVELSTRSLFFAVSVSDMDYSIILVFNFSQIWACSRPNLHLN